MRVTQHFEISGLVPFLDVDVVNDSPLFVQPAAIRRSRHPLASQAQARITSYSAEVIRLRVSNRPVDHVHGRRLLMEGLNEPHQTRLGYSTTGSYGHGLGPVKGRLLWEALDDDLCRQSLLSELEHLPLFVPGVDKDLISDMTTRLIFPELVVFTREMMGLYPQLAQRTRKVSVKVWDASAGRWSTAEYRLPLVAGRSLLLIPSGWVDHRLLLSPEQFYNRVATATVQAERARQVGERLLAPSKSALNKEFRDRRWLNRHQSLNYADKRRNLVQEYVTFSADYYAEPLPVEELLGRIASGSVAA